MLDSSSSVIALDVGGQRIGIATANVIAKIAHPLTTIQNDADVMHTLQKLLQEERAIVVVVGLPRGMSGQSTGQTQATEAFVEELGKHISQPIELQDEAVTSQQAEAELKSRGKPYEKGDIDALAATYILEDYLRDHPEIRI